MIKGKSLLTSSGLSSENVAQKFKSLLTNPSDQKVAIVTTAADGKEQNKYSQLAKRQLEDMGFTQIDFIDLEFESDKDFSTYSVIYVCGGNTFKLLKFARETNFKNVIENLLSRDGIYVGVSAGSIIVGSSIQVAGEIEPDPNDVGLTDLTGLRITDVIILPHYRPDLENEILEFEKRHGVKVERLDDSQALLIQHNRKMVIQ